MADAVAMGHTLTLAPKEAEAICLNAGGSSGQGDLIQALARTPLAVAEFTGHSRLSRFDTAHLGRYDGTDYAQWQGRAADGHFHSFGRIMQIVKVPAPRDYRQRRVVEWGTEAFGAEQVTSIPQRGIRLLEEAVEAAQAAGVPIDMARRMVDFVYSRPSGNLPQELGGVAVCLLALANAAGVSADECEIREIDRVLAKGAAHFAARNAAKNDAGFLAVEALTP